MVRELRERESNAPKWRELLNILRRLEARGEIRGGRFVSGCGGEQVALPEAVESLRMSRSVESPQEIVVAGADAMNLAGIVVPGTRVAAVPGRFLRFRNGAVVEDENARPSATSQAANDLPPLDPPAPAPALRLF